ncbi:hypothetical protein ElyMa_006824900 [Elysia marginata]|uniref:Uncharacterized protein n=1 Tax=Elysia marginata TaxID=1093978 RepID=A0AAV4J6G8_9GAST|nr:hypothetical protein ElyMa_006824900 [Elysia marginata]
MLSASTAGPPGLPCLTHVLPRAVLPMSYKLCPRKLRRRKKQMKVLNTPHPPSSLISSVPSQPACLYYRGTNSTRTKTPNGKDSSGSSLTPKSTGTNSTHTKTLNGKDSSGSSLTPRQSLRL